MAEDGSAGVRSVNLALDILEAVGFADEELGVTQYPAVHESKKKELANE